MSKFRNSPPEVFFVKGVLKICCKLTEEHPCQSVILIKLLCKFIEIALRHGCSPVNLPHIFGKPFPKNTSGWSFLEFVENTILFPSIQRSRYLSQLFQTRVYSLNYYYLFLRYFHFCFEFYWRRARHVITVIYGLLDPGGYEYKWN